jgi:Ca2+-binding RTX toxin-like protein
LLSSSKKIFYGLESFFSQLKTFWLVIVRATHFNLSTYKVCDVDYARRSPYLSAIRLGDVVLESLNQGIDTVISTSNHTLRANLENLTLAGAGNLRGTGNNLNNSLRGNAGDNILNGGIGSDTFDGGAGNDTLIGSLGNDLYYANSLGDVVLESLNQGIDTVISTSNHTLRANLENGSSAFTMLNC